MYIYKCGSLQGKELLLSKSSVSQTSQCRWYFKHET